MSEKNWAVVTGEVANEPEFNHEMFGEKLYTFQLNSSRMSGIEDSVPLLVSERLTDISLIHPGDLLKAEGELRSYNREIDGKRRLVLFLFVKKIEVMTDLSHDRNMIDLEGYICKPPVFRNTPFGRSITDVFLAVNRNYGKSDYIPCICWNRNANYVSNLPVGTCIRLRGRIQSREYVKKTEEESISRVAYEVSVNRLEEVPEEPRISSDDQTEVLPEPAEEQKEAV